MVKKELIKHTMAAAIVALGIVTTGCSKRTVDVPSYVESNPAVSNVIGETEEVITSHVATYGDAETTESSEEDGTLESYINEEYTKEIKEASSESTEVDTKKVDTKKQEETTEMSTPIQTTTRASTSTSTQSATEPATQESTTEAPTQEPTIPQTTESPTEPPVSRPTEPPTEKPTTAPHSHSYTSEVTLAPTCVSAGVRTYKCVCGDSYTESIVATGHRFGAYTYNNDATEQADGTETAVCSICGERTTRTASGTKLAHVHSYASAVTKAATCAEEGITTYTCSCGDSYTQAISMTAHSFGDYVYNNDATTDADGTQTRVCSVCGATDTVTAEGTKKSLPSWYDEHSQQLNVATGSQHDGSLEVWFVAGQFDWTGACEGCWDFGYSPEFEYVGEYAEGGIGHGWLSKN